jgi:phosphoenolpyruvate-protein phosphotransferase
MRQLPGIPASPGIGLAPAYVYHPTDIVIQRLSCDDPLAEWARYQTAAAQALTDLAVLRAQVAADVGEGEAAIFDAHQMIVTDPELEIDLRAQINAGASAEAAVQSVYRREIETFAAKADPVFRERAIDFADVELRLLQCLLGVRDETLGDMDRPAIIVARDLKPSDTAHLNRAFVRGFCTAEGGPLSHTAILARNLGLPAVVGMGEAIMEIAPDSPLVVDGTHGVVVTEATEAECRKYEKAAAALAAARAAALAAAHEPATTLDGLTVEVAANTGLPGEEAEALQAGAEGIGLLRTEFLFVDRKTAPSEADHYRAYRPIIGAMGGRPVIARTFDIGGDKPVDFLAIPPEANPFLGWRAIRIGLARPDLLRTQLRALLRAGHGGNLKIMFPMIATTGEMQMARGLYDEARAELIAEGADIAAEVEVGAMVEIPAAAITADQLAPYVDFFSIGSNDLTQYTLAADRGNPAVAGLFDSLHPAVLRLVDQVIRAADAHGRWVGMCGEMAGDLTAIPVLLGLGLDEFSMGAAAIPLAKALIRRLHTGEAAALARQALALPSAQAVRELIEGWLRERQLG